MTFLLPANEVWEGYVFTPVCHSVHRGVSASVYAGIHPPGANTPLGSRHPHPRSRHPTPTPPGSRQTPPCSACWEIRATSGRYASYWNAYLLLWNLLTICKFISFFCASSSIFFASLLTPRVLLSKPLSLY